MWLLVESVLNPGGGSINFWENEIISTRVVSIEPKSVCHLCTRLVSCSQTLHIGCGQRKTQGGN